MAELNSIKRLSFIDTSKGIGIVAVVFAHISFPNYLTACIYMFHMPLFFFISGYLFSTKKDEKNNFYTKLITLGIPYLSFLCIISTFQLYHFFYDEIAFRDSKNILFFFGRMFLGGRWLSGEATVFWFPSVLFIVLLIMNFFLIRIRNIKVAGLMILFLLLSYVNSIYFQNIRIPLDANVALAACPIFYAGYIHKNIDFRKYIFWCIIISLSAIFLLLKDYLPIIDYKNSKYGIPILSFLVSISFIKLVLEIALFISERIVIVSRFLESLGKASLVIMYLHQPIQIIINGYVSENIFIRILLSIFLSYVFYFLVSKTKYGRIFFIGSKKDFDEVFKSSLI